MAIYSRSSIQNVKVKLSPSKNFALFALLKDLENDLKNAFYFFLKALFVLKIFKFLSWLFGHVEKKTWLERQGWFQNSWRHNLAK